MPTGPPKVRSWAWGGADGEEGVAETPVGATVQVLGMVGGQTVGQGSLRFGLDGVGSVVARINAAAPSSPTLYGYTAYGEFGSASALGLSTPPDTTQASQAYAGLRYDADANLSYAQQRWYRPETGTFLSRDSVGVGSYLATPNGLGTWAYGALNPEGHIDPRGSDANVVPLGGLDPAQRSALLAQLKGRLNAPSYSDVQGYDDDELTTAYERYVLGEEFSTDTRVATAQFILRNRETRFSWFARNAASVVGAGVDAVANSRAGKAFDEAREASGEAGRDVARGTLDGLQPWQRADPTLYGRQNAASTARKSDFENAYGEEGGKFAFDQAAAHGAGKFIHSAGAAVGAIKDLSKEGALLGKELRAAPEAVRPVRAAAFGQAAKLSKATPSRDLAEAMYRLREQSGLLSEDTFAARNVASARVLVNGEARILTRANVPHGLHSEEVLAAEIEKLRMQGATVTVEELITERIPCSTATCRAVISQSMPGARVYFFTAGHSSVAGRDLIRKYLELGLSK